MTRALRVGLAQIPVTAGRSTENVERIVSALDEAARSECDIVVTPECAISGWLCPPETTDVQQIPGPIVDLVGQRCRQLGMAVVLGMEEMRGHDRFNSAVFLDRDGEIRNVHRKINEVDIGRHRYRRGDSVGVFEFDGVTLGITICADSWITPIVGAMHAMGAEIILSPCAWAIIPGDESKNTAWISDAYRSHTAERDDLYIIATNAIGALEPPHPWAGRILHGDSLAYGPGGTQIAHGPRNRSAMLTVDVTLAA